MGAKVRLPLPPLLWSETMVVPLHAATATAQTKAALSQRTCGYVDLSCIAVPYGRRFRAGAAVG